MRKDEEVKEMFALGIEFLEREFRTKATITYNGIWITVEFGKIAKVTGRGYVATMNLLGDELDKLVSL